MKRILKKLNYKLSRQKGIFYPKFADQWSDYHQSKLRGAVEEIKKRQSIYLSYINQISSSIKKYPFLEVGFGRGEFLELLKSTKLSSIKGVDNNLLFVKNAKKKGFDAYHSDALEYLYLSKDLFSGISAFHFIEHLHFFQLFDFLYMCSHKITKGGKLILETPNIENIQVSSINYYFDFTHIQKITPILLRTLLEFFKFSKIEFLYLHPMKSKLRTNLDKLLYGAQDLGIIATK